MRYASSAWARKGLPFAPQAAATLLYAVLALVCCLEFLYNPPWYPVAGLDPSWEFGITTAIAENMRFGPQISFTYGPYASTIIQLFHPGALSARLIGGTILAAGVVAAATALAKANVLSLALFLCSLLVSSFYSRDALFFFVILAASLACIDSARESGAKRLAMGRIACLFLSLSLLTLTKGTHAMAACAASGIIAAYFLYVRRAALAYTALGTALVAVPSLWLLAGQRLADFPAYASSLFAVSSGYTEAMMSFSHPSDIGLFLLAAALLIGAGMADGARPRRERIAARCVLSVLLFIVFKGAFVRHDFGHVVIAAVFLAGAAVLLCAASENRTYSLASCLGVFFLCLALLSQNSENLGGFVVAQLRAKIQGYSYRSYSEKLRLYEDSLAKLRALMPLPSLPGTADLYSYDQAYLLASGNTWNPRPVFQSYSAYTPELLEANRRHVAGSEAPDTIFFAVQPIDDRFPSTEDGLSWPELLSRYAPHSWDQSFLTLRRRPSPAPLLRTPVATPASLSFGETFTLPEHSGALFLRLDARPTLLGKLAAIVFKPPMLHLETTLADGTVMRKRIVSGMTRSGFCVSPYIADAFDFCALYGLPAEAGRKAVCVTVLLEEGFPRLFWAPTIGLSAEELRLTTSLPFRQQAPIPLTPDDPAQAHNAAAALRPDGFFLDSDVEGVNRADPSLQLRPFSCDKALGIELRVAMTRSVAGNVELYWKDAHTEYAEDRARRKACQSGSIEARFLIPNAPDDGAVHLRLDPFTQAGEATIHRVEALCLQRPQ